MSIKTRLILIAALMIAVLIAGVGSLWWGSYQVRAQVRLVLPAINALQCIADARADLVMHLKELMDYLASGDLRAKEEQKRFAADVGRAMENAVRISRLQQELGIQGEDDDLARLRDMQQQLAAWQSVVQRVVAMGEAGERTASLRVFEQQVHPIVYGRLMTGIEELIDDAYGEVQEANQNLLMATGAIPWLSGRSDELRKSLLSIDYYVAVSRAHEHFHTQLLELVSYLLIGDVKHQQEYPLAASLTEGSMREWVAIARRKIPNDKNDATDLRRAQEVVQSYRQVSSLAERVIAGSGKVSDAVAVKREIDRVVNKDLLPGIAWALADSRKEIVSTQQQLYRLATTVVWQGGLAALLAGLLVVIGAVLLVRGLLAPLKQLRAGIEIIGSGKLEHRVVTSRTDEFAQLAAAFNVMAGQLQQSRADIELLNRLLEGKVQQLERANRELDSFGASVSHDLRRPLTAINGYAQVLLEDFGTQFSPQVREFLQQIYRSGQHMNLLIDELRKLAQMARIDYFRQDVDLGAIAREVADELAAREPERRVRFHIQPGVRANADPKLLRVVFENLLGNAWKYTSRKDEATIEFAYRAEPTGRVYYVRDDGAGFDMKQMDRLFQPFQRLHSSDDFEGTGVGLATVQRIIDRHGGRIWAEGEPGRGATFHFTLGDERERSWRQRTQPP